MSNKKQIRLFKRLKATANGKSSVVFLNNIDKSSSTKNTAKNLAVVKKMIQAFILLGRS